MFNFLKIIVLFLITSLKSDIIPENGLQVNYIQVFFKWNQLPNIDYYKLHITNTTSGIEHLIETPKNSILITDSLEWMAHYEWFVCGYFDNGTQT